MSRFSLAAVQLVLLVFCCVLPASGSTIISGSVIRETDDRVYIDRDNGYMWRGPVGNHSPGSEALQQYPTFRFPTRDEVAALFQHFGFPPLPEGFDGVDVDPVLGDLFRQMTQDGANVFGTYIDGDLLGRIGLDSANRLSVQPPTLQLSDPITFEGHWLVRVPEPSSLAILGVGMFTLFAAARPGHNGRYWA